MPPSPRLHGQLLVIIFAQFAGTSLWFAGNAVLPELQPWLKTTGLTSWITSSVQIGFITGTLVYALLAIPDRLRSTSVFLTSVILAALVNLVWLFFPIKAETILISRFLTGFFLAGVYPVGMKIAAERFKAGLGQAMGFLVGALVLGTAFPYLLQELGTHLPYRAVTLSVSLLAISGGILMGLTVPASPVRSGGIFFRFQTLLVLGQPSSFRPAMLGYFGHMWELYTLWAYLPALISYYRQQHPEVELTNSLWAFGAIAAGAVGCGAGGFLASRIGSARVARYLLLTSGVCIVLTPWALSLTPSALGLFLLVWGAAAAGDSPQFSTLVASHTTVENRGSILTLVTCVGFLLTVISIQLMSWLVTHAGMSGWLFYMLLPGPLLGLWAIRKMV
ncbi:MFS transporter [Spirosoma radiotolerans]|uniref:MFS transporter n=1 Tax=Spirosoma radiotolerans TaxID=1379870 RepID=A0A0E3VAN7_9BACT|nr:MFS transporter [Spirosoma radiotolerans]AKD58396.1 MFS transporter [Spirosoma radiotolerans]